ncbi:MAG: TonB-dependent receptor [Erythrobacter sp.]|uniref:TonB-dependent receptor n=1 Tax=Erythrobacter sp. TaxID=1042 RepID=UPI003296E720
MTDRWNYGAYIQNIVDIGEQFSIMVGGRYERQDVDFIEQVSGATEGQTISDFLPQGGVVFKPTQSTSIYASYTKSFSENSVERRDALGGSFDPERGKQIEIGAKASLWDERINVTLAVFDIEKTNILERDANRDFMLLGELESQGIEFELQALPIEHWQIRVGYAYVDSIISESPDTSLIGARNAFAPAHDGFVWTRYNVPTAVLGGEVGVSLGVNFESKRFTNASAATRVELPSTARVDTAVYYETDNFALALNIENLFDETYFIGGTTDVRLYPGKPRLITLTASTSF